jgi:hypothetical protein
LNHNPNNPSQLTWIKIQPKRLSNQSATEHIQSTNL